MFKPGDVPVPGYTLLGLLGRGQYGEVWEATGPGGTRLAIKFISLQGNKGRIELKSIQAVKLIRHANLIPINAIWMLDVDGKVLNAEAAAEAMSQSQMPRKTTQTMFEGVAEQANRLGYLVICMAKADGSLEQRLQRSIDAGQSGIDPKELVRYIREAASGLDFLNSPQHLVNGELVGIQHRDVKPANLLLMGDTVVVGDFGVSTTVREFDATMTAVVGSLAFMAPESLSQKTSPTSDQYALAITYYQLRCNQLPYDGTAPLDQIIMVHKEGRLEFKAVSEAEQKVLRRATNISPNDRYESCREFAEALADSLRPAPPVQIVVAKTGFPVVPVVGALAALIGVAAFLIIDPANWFGKTIEPPPPQARSVTLSFVPGGISGDVTVSHADSTQPESKVTVSGFTNLQLFPDDSVSIRTESENPFIGVIEEKYSVVQLEAMNWRIDLPKISLAMVLGEVDRLADENKLNEASAIYAQAAKFEVSLRTPPEAIKLETGDVTHFSVDPTSGTVAFSTREKPQGDSAAIDSVFIVRNENRKLKTDSMPLPESSQSPVESLCFGKNGQELIVVRQLSIERWTIGSGSTTTLPASQAAEPSSRWLKARVSADGNWLAAANFANSVRLWNLNDNSVTGKKMSFELDASIIDLIFSPDNRKLAVVTESTPIRWLDLTSGLELAEPLQQAKTQPDLNGDYILHAIATSTGSLVVATETGFTTGNGFFTTAPDPFGPARTINNGSVSILAGSMNSQRVIVGSDGDPAAMVFDLASEKPLAEIGREKIGSARELGLSSDGNWAVVAGRNGTLGIIDLRQTPGRWIPFQKLEGKNFGFASFSGDTRYLYAVSPGHLHLWDFRRCQMAWDAQLKVK